MIITITIKVQLLEEDNPSCMDKLLPLLEDLVTKTGFDLYDSNWKESQDD